MSHLAVITGGTKGIGRSLIFLFGSKGFNIVTCSRNKEDLEALKQSFIKENPEAEFYYMVSDLSKKDNVAEFAHFVKGINQPVEVLINNSGLFLPGLIHEEEEGTLEKLMDINLYSAYYLTRHLIHDMKTRKKGHVFNMCSTASIKAMPNGGSYCISKFAMLGMTRVLREEMKDHHVRVTAVMPGPTSTASWEGANIPEERFMPPDDVAKSIWNAYEMSDRTVMEELIMRPQEGDL